jgi:hypothetical protein
VYLDGLQYNSPHASLSGRSALARARIPRRRVSPRQNPFSRQAEKGEKGLAFGDRSPRAPDPGSDADYWRRSSLGLSGSQFSRPSRRGKDCDETRPTLSTFVSYHHPCSLDFLEFILWKLVALLGTWVLVVLYWLAMFPHLTAPPLPSVLSSRRSFLALEGLLFSLTVLWVYWLAAAYCSTLRRLKRAKLLSSRFRHIAFRAIAFQVGGTYCITAPLHHRLEPSRGPYSLIVSKLLPRTPSRSSPASLSSR